MPALWYWKGVLGEGVDIPALTAHIDLYKTFCDLAGIDIPGDIQEIDGRTLLPLLENPKAVWPDRRLYVHKGRWPKDTDPDKFIYADCAVRTHRWRMVATGKSKGDFELYDISKDPYEKEDVADQYPEVVKELKTAYDQWWDATVPLMVNEDRPYAEANPQAVRYEKQLKEKGIPDWVPPEL